MSPHSGVTGRSGSRASGGPGKAEMRSGHGGAWSEIASSVVPATQRRSRTPVSLQPSR